MMDEEYEEQELRQIVFTVTPTQFSGNAMRHALCAMRFYL